MWNKALELNTARCLEQNNSVALQPGLKLRPEVFDIRCSDHSVTLLVFLERGRELANSGDDIGARCQRETSDVGMTLL